MTKMETRIKKFMMSESPMTHHSYYDETFISKIIATLTDEDKNQSKNVLTDGVETGSDYNSVMDYIVDDLLFDRGYNTPINGDHKVVE